MLRVAPWVVGGSALILVAGFVDGGHDPRSGSLHSPSDSSGQRSAAYADSDSSPPTSSNAISDRDHRDRRVARRDRARRAGHATRHRRLITAVLGLVVARRSGWRTSTSSRSADGSCSASAAARHAPRSPATSTPTSTCRCRRHRPVRVRDEGDAPPPSRRARTIEALALCGGPALFLFAFVASALPGVTHARTRSAGRSDRVRCLIPVAARRAGARRARAGGSGLGRAPRVRAHLVARRARRGEDAAIRDAELKA